MTLLYALFEMLKLIVKKWQLKSLYWLVIALFNAQDDDYQLCLLAVFVQIDH